MQAERLVSEADLQKERISQQDASLQSTQQMEARIEQENEALRKEMQQAAKDLRFEEAAYLRDRIKELEMTK